jgi:hypothetical protein
MPTRSLGVRPPLIRFQLRYAPLSKNIACSAAVQGFAPSEPGRNSEEPLQPPSGFSPPTQPNPPSPSGMSRWVSHLYCLRNIGTAWSVVPLRRLLVTKMSNPALMNHAGSSPSASLESTRRSGCTLLHDDRGVGAEPKVEQLKPNFGWQL